MALCHSAFTAITLPDGNASCAPTCPLAYYSDMQYDALFITSTVLGLLAAVTSFLAAIPHLAIPSRRTWPHVILPILFLCVFVIGVRFVLPIAGFGFKYRQFICDGDTHSLHSGSTNKWCALDGVMTYAPAIMAVFQWGAIDIYLTLRMLGINSGSYKGGRESRLSTRAQVIVVYGIIGTYVIVTTAILLAKDEFGATGEGGHCFIKPGRFYNGFWIAPLIALIFIAVINTIIVVIYMLFIASSKSQAIKFLIGQWRIIGFVLIFLFAAATFVIFWLVWNPQQDTVTESVIAWIGCSGTEYYRLISAGALTSAANDEVDRICRPLLRVPPYATTFFMGNIIPIAALTFTLFFLLQRDIIAWWFNLFSCGRAYGDKLFGTTVSSNTSGHDRPSVSYHPEHESSVDAWNSN